MKIKIIFCLLFLASALHAQTVKFDRYYTFDNWSALRGVVQTPSGDYVSVGYNIAEDSLGNESVDALLLKTDAFGDTLLVKHFGQGDTSFFHLFGRNGDDGFNDIILTRDSNLVIIGVTEDFGCTNFYDYDAWIIKTNFNGDTLWTKVFSYPGDTTFIPKSVIQTSDNGFLVAGAIYPFINFDERGVLLKLDSIGNMQWLKSYYNPPTQYLNGVVETIDHGFICNGGYSTSGFYNFNPLLYKVDSFGNQQWQILLTQSSGPDGGINIIKTKDSNYVATAYLRLGLFDSDSVAFRVLKINNNGGIIWQKQYLTTYNGALFVGLAENNNLFIAGGVDNNQTQYVDGFIMKLDVNGDSLWYRTFGTLDYDWLLSGQQTVDGGYILSGETYCCNFSPGIGWTSSTWLVKTDSLGFLIPTGINENASIKGAKLGNAFPNPTSNYFNITSIIPQISETGIGKKGDYLFLFDAIGRQVKEISLAQGINNTLVDVSYFCPGIYLCVLVIDGYNAGSVKIVKE